MLDAYLEKVPGSVRQAHSEFEEDTNDSEAFTEVPKKFLALLNDLAKNDERRVNDLANKETRGTVKRILRRVHPPPKRTSKVLEQETVVDKVKCREVRFEVKCPICGKAESVTKTLPLKDVQQKNIKLPIRRGRPPRDVFLSLDEWADE